MDFSKLSSNDKLAAIGAVAAIVGAFLSFGGGGSFGVLTGIAMLVIIFLPQFSPSTKLPGSKGSLMLIVGGVAGIGALLALLALLPVLGAIGFYGGTWLIGLLLSAAGGALMGWASWQTFQAEGGKFNMGTSSAPSAPPPPPAPTYSPPPPAAPPTQEPMSDGTEDRPQG
ncbi:MAG: hypothetical protein M3P32_05475 [Chloroflexota bacterium]|nr:hypothetical protein [Chloroflexota bacterium]